MLAVSRALKIRLHTNFSRVFVARIVWEARSIVRVWNTLAQVPVPAQGMKLHASLLMGLALLRQYVCQHLVDSSSDRGVVFQRPVLVSHDSACGHPVEVWMFHGKVNEFVPVAVILLPSLATDPQLKGSPSTGGTVCHINAVDTGVIISAIGGEPKGRVDQVCGPLRVGIVRFSQTFFVLLHLGVLRYFCRLATTAHNEGWSSSLLARPSNLFIMLVTIANIVISIVPITAGGLFVFGGGLS